MWNRDGSHLRNFSRERYLQKFSVTVPRYLPFTILVLKLSFIRFLPPVGLVLEVFRKGKPFHRRWFGWSVPFSSRVVEVERLIRQLFETLSAEYDALNSLVDKARPLIQ